MSIPSDADTRRVVITVRGEDAAEVAPQLATATVSARVEGADRADVVRQATALADELTAELAAAQAAGAAASWSSDRVAVWSDRPWSQDGAVLPLVHHAAVTARAEFTDFEALATWLSQAAEREGVSVDDVSWSLTEDTRRETEARVAQGAVGAAVARAEAYAAALGLSDVVPLEIADVGLLTAAAAESAPMAMAMKSFDRAGGSPSLSLAPRPLRVGATVEARFTAR